MDAVTTLAMTGRAPTPASAERLKCPLCPIGRQKTYSVRPYRPDPKTPTRAQQSKAPWPRRCTAVPEGVSLVSGEAAQPYCLGDLDLVHPVAIIDRSEVPFIGKIIIGNPERSVPPIPPHNLHTAG